MKLERALAPSIALWPRNHVKAVFSIAHAVEFARRSEEFVFPRESLPVIGRSALGCERHFRNLALETRSETARCGHEAEERKQQRYE